MQALLLPTGRLGGAPPARPPSAATYPFPAYLHRPPRPPPSFSHAPAPSLSSSSKSLSLSYITLRKRPKSLASAPISAAYSSSNDESERAKLAQVSKRLENTAMHFKRLGSLGFWGQLVCTVVAAVILAFSVVITGKITSPATFYATAGGIVAAFISVFWSFGYVRMSDKLRKTANDPSKAPPRADVVKSLKNGIVLNLLGMGAAVLGIQATVGSLVAKALTSSAIPYYQGTSPAYSPVLALDVFLVQASANTIISHFLGLVFSLELLRSVTLPPSESIPVPRTV
ncbi:protein TIC 21, chloroplastic-like [Actinidia eriantha]|uniref:protein TIC 21, chloroplastic-like n=1 Tax=Actinidia eriantha TaxID=165200 RepID=UPI0025864C0C|nr:protein TIC 21, chloroplastic-like [Actinidia eriantha]